MIGEHAKNNLCPLCGGRLQVGLATIPFVLPEMVVLIKAVPAEVCRSCHEPYMIGRVTDKVLHLLHQARTLPTEVSILTYTETHKQPELVPVAA